MPFPRPTLSELRGQVATDLATALPGADALLRYSNLGIMGQGQAALAHGHYGYLDWIARQAVPFSATGEHLEGWAALKGVIRKPATGAVGAATFAAVAGATVPAQTRLTRSDGVVYATNAEVTATGASLTVAVRAITLGAATNADAGVGLTMSTGAPGVSSTGTFTTPATGGADLEDDDSLRSRMLAAYAAPAQGGSEADFRSWALEVPGVTRAWIVPAGMGPGTVVVFFMLDDAQAAHGGFPQGSSGVATAEVRDVAATGDQLALANALHARAPVPLIVYAVAPTANQVSLTIAGLASAPVSVRTAVASAIRTALLRQARPGGVTPLSAIESAVASVTGTEGFLVTAISCSAGTIAPGPVGNIVSSAGALPVLGGITWP